MSMALSVTCSESHFVAMMWAMRTDFLLGVAELGARANG